MKGLQTLILKYLKDHEKHKRYLSIIMCLSMIVTFAVPMSLIMPAISMTRDADSGEDINVAEPLAYNNNIGKSLDNLKNANGGVGGNEVDGKIYSPGELSLKTLLVGDGDGVAWAENCNDIDALMDAAMDEYFLGIANDFCAFIEGDFAATEADAEGRVFIGGDLTFSNAWNYQVGSGDYATMTNLEATDNYEGSISDFASIIVGGKIKNINTLSTGYGHNRNGIDDWSEEDRKSKDAGYHSVNNSQYSYTVYYKPEQGMYKRIVIGNIEDSTHIYGDAGAGYTSSHSHDYPGNCGDGCTHTYLDNINELAQMYQYGGIPYIVEKSFEQIRERSSLLSKKKAISASGTDGTIHLIGPGVDSKEKTVYFNVGDSWGGYTNIYFDDIPESANIVINCGGNTVNISGDVNTWINNKTISGVSDDNPTGGRNETHNNQKPSERILYNFYDATNVTINGNFNGTILAPNADVISKEDECPGHLSGALIAKSFKGGLEFGYRPYRGAADILGSSSGYVIPVDKFDNNNKPLPGASFEIVDNDTQELVSAWISSDKTKYASIPTAVDYSGETDYTDITKYGTDNNIVITKNYTLEEVSAPDGYIKEENCYKITVKETIDKDYLLQQSGKVYPQKVNVEVCIAKYQKGNNDTYDVKIADTEQTLKFTVKETFEINAPEKQRRIYIDDSEDAFAIDFTVDGDQKALTSVKKISHADNSDESLTVTYPPSIVTSTTAEKGDALTTTSASNTFTINPDKTECTVGDTVILNVSGATGEIDWDYNDDDYTINKVEDNDSQYKLTVKKSGWLEITGTITGTDSEVKTGCCVVYVNPFAITNVSEISIDGTVTFTANQPANWSIDNTNLAVISSDTNSAECTVTFNENAHGNATLTATYDNNNTATAELSVPEPKTSQIVNKVDDDTEGSIVDPTKSGNFTIGDNKYYYSNDSLMVMPLPAQNLTFVNKPGMVLRKVDDEGKAVKGAEISITPDIGDYWKYDMDTGKGTVDLDVLNSETVYKFSETKTPGGYEDANDIYFMWNGENQIKYWTKEDQSDLKTVTLPGEHTIFMTDQRKLGVIPKLQKVHYEDENGSREILPGATIELYAKNGDLICTWEDFTGVETSMKEALDSVTDSPYVEKGYLKPGIYYLQETVIPKCNGEEHKDPGRMYFTVASDFTIEPGYSAIKEIEKIKNDPNEKQFKPKDVDVIENVSYFCIIANNNIEQIYNVGTLDGKVNWDKKFNKSFSSYETWSYVDNTQPIKVMNYSDGIDVIYIEIKTSDGLKYVYGTNPDASDSSESTENSNVNNNLEISSDLLLTVINKPQGNQKNITIEKKWEGDEEFSYLRSEITYTLYKTTEDIIQYSDNERTEKLKKLVDEKKATEILQSDLQNEVTDEDDSTKKYINPQKFELSADNEWKQTIYGLPTKSGTDKLYYFVIEESVLQSYAEFYEFKGDFIEITNELQKIKINAVKEWDVGNITNINKPATLNLTLQMKNPGESDEAWRDIRTITLTAADDWQKVIEGLPAGKEYRLMENNPPPGWYCSEVDNVSAVKSENNDTLTITNKPLTAPLTIRKFWEDDNASQRTSVKFRLYRTTKRPADQMPYPVNQTPEETQQDYARLLQYSLYFYDGVMCGDQVGANSAYSWRSDCHTEDDVPGGFHDAGDHVMFGLPGGFSAMNLGWSLYEFNNVYNNLNQTDHAKLILDHYAKYFRESIRTNSEDQTEILYQKGKGQIDHKYWGIPEQQPNRSDQSYWVSNAGSDIAGEYAAALALNYLNFGNIEDLNKAIEFYEFAESVNCKVEGETLDPTTANEYDFYASKDHKDDMAMAAVWISVACKKANNGNANTYKDKAVTLLNGNFAEWEGYHYNEVQYGAYLAAAMNLDLDDNTKNAYKSKVEEKINSWINKGDYWSQDEWGYSRYVNGYATLALIDAKFTKQDQNSNTVKWAQRQMQTMLGNNTWGQNGDPLCLITGFSKYSPQRPHFRASSGLVTDMNTADDATIIDGYEDKNILIGGIIGGPMKNGTYKNNAGQYVAFDDKRSEYAVNEVASDYNSVLISATAGLYYFIPSGQTYMISEAAGVDKQYVTADTVAGDYYKIETEPVAVQSRSAALPMLTMSMAKAIRSAENVIIFDESNNSELFNEIKRNGANVSELCSGKAITKIEIYAVDFGEKIEGRVMWNSWAGQKSWSISHGESSTSIILDSPVNMELFTCFKDYAQLDSWAIAEIRLYYNSSSGSDTPDQPEITTTTTTAQPDQSTTTTTTTTTPTPPNTPHNVYVWNIGKASDNPGSTLEISTVDKLKGNKITGIEVHVNSCQNGANGIIFFNGNYEENKIATSSPFTYSVDSSKYDGNNLSSVTFRNWYGLNDVDIWFYYDEPPKFDIERTSEENIYPGDTATFTVTLNDVLVSDIDESEWTIPENGGSIINNGDGTYTYTAGGKFGDIKISCSKDGTKGDITIRTNEITATPTDITVRSGTTDTQQIGVVPSGDITYESSDENVATVDENGNVSFHNVGDAVITICRKGIPTDCKVNVKVFGDLAIRGADNGQIVIKPNEPLKLEVINGIGDVTWELTGTVPDGVTLNGNTITATENCEVIATDDYDGTQKTVTIVVKDMAEIVDTTGMEPVEIDGKDYIYITANTNWEYKILDLPITDEHGNYYYYYIVEVDENGNPIADDNVLSGNGAKYIPISYDGNGQNLSENDDNIISVTNKKIADTLGELPMTGGDGTTRYYVTGIAILSTAAAYYLIRRRRRRVAK